MDHIHRMETFSRLSGWANYPKVPCRILTPEDLKDVLLKEKSLIARGNGRALGDSALNPRGTLLMKSRNRLLAFKDGLLTCESGVLLADILKFAVPKGFFPPVVPGTKFVTVGGMIAADVHGKNHLSAGSFCRHVRHIDLLAGEGEIIRCSPEENSDLFHATCGGMGWTGVILSASIQLRPLESSLIKQNVIRCGSLEETLEQMEKSQATYIAAWLDGFRLNRGLVIRGDHMPGKKLETPKRAPWRTPFYFPRFTLNSLTMRLFNEFYYRRPYSELVNYDPFLFPLDSLLEWNKLYGPRGFAQHQCVFPLHNGRYGLKTLLSVLEKSRLKPFLCILKRFGPQDSGLMSFPMEGYTLALDFPLRREVPHLFKKLNFVVEEFGGRTYLAKDALMPAEHFKKTYSRFEEFQKIRRAYGAEKFVSLQSMRLFM